MPIAPWVSVEPNDNPDALLGNLPLTQESIVYQIPDCVVPPTATGIMVFAWYAAAGPVPQAGFWHFAVNIGGGVQNWFSLFLSGLNAEQPVAACNSQVFWLPMPVDGLLTVTFGNGLLLPGTCQGGVEIHGYYP